MSYIIYYSDPAKFSYPITVLDNTVYNSVGTGGLTLVGRNYPGYGQFVAENFIKLLENFSGPVPPVNPIEGQLWYDSNTRKLRVNDGAASNAVWKPINGIFQQSVEPTNVLDGDIWVDTSRNQIFLYGNNIWNLVGPEFSSAVEAGPKVETVQDILGNPHDIVKIYLDGSEVAIFADSDFTPQSVINGFSTLKAGLNLKNNSVLNGIADGANFVYQNGAKVSGNALLRNDINQTMGGQLTITQDGSAIRIGTDPTFILERTVNGSNANFVNTYQSFGTFSFNIRNSTGGNVRLLTMGGNPQQVIIPASTPATSTSTGALVVGGGVGIGSDLFVGGNLTFSNPTANLTVGNIDVIGNTTSTSTSTGALKVLGGVGVGGNLYVGGNISVPRSFFAANGPGFNGQILVTRGSYVEWINTPQTSTTTSFLSTVTAIGIIETLDPTNATSTSTGALRVRGGAGIGRDLWVGGDITGTNIAGASIAVSGTGSFNTVAVNATTPSTTSSNGALVVQGGVGIRGDLYVAGGVFSSRLTIDETIINSTVVQTNDVFTITNTLNATSTNSGALRVAGGAGIGRNLYVGGSGYFTGTVFVNGQALVTQNTYVINTGTGSTVGGVKIGSTIVASVDGTININTSTPMLTATYATFVSTTATIARLGGVKIGDNIDVEFDGTINVPVATDTVQGVVNVPVVSASGLDLVNGVLSLATATTLLRGGVRVPTGGGINVSSNGSISINTATLMSNAVTANFLTTIASSSTAGVVRIGPSIAVDGSGTINVNILPATTSTLGGVKQNPDFPSIVIAGDGEIGVNINFSTTGTGLDFGFDWSTTTNRYEVSYSLNTASVTTLGGVKIGTGIGVAPDGTISVTTGSFALQTATNAILGGVKVGTTLNAIGDGTININTATASQVGGIRVGTGLSIAGDATLSLNTATLVATAVNALNVNFTTTATATVLGLVKIGTGINAAGDGTISLNTATLVSTAVAIVTTATGSTLGAIKIGSGFLTTVDGTVSVDPSAVYALPTATNVTLGGVKIGTGINAAGDGTISLNTATLVQQAVSAISISTTATTTTLGAVKIGTGINAAGDGTISINTATLVNTSTFATFISTPATGSILGGVKIGTGIAVTLDGTISLNTATLVQQAVNATFISATATNVVLGGVRIGSGINAGTDGTISLNTSTLMTTAVAIITTATDTVLGAVKIGTGINAAGDGTISLNTATLVNTATFATFISSTATAATLGGVRIGSGIDITALGVISLNTSTLMTTATTARFISTTATSTTLGGVRIGSNLTALGDGTISFNTATLVGTAVSIVSTATAATLGGVRIGSGINASPTGVISLNTTTLMTTATTARFVSSPGTTSTIGGVKQGFGPIGEYSVGIDFDGSLFINFNFINSTGTEAVIAWNTSTGQYDVAWSRSDIRNSGYNVPYDTSTAMDNLMARVTTSGVAQLKANTATLTAAWSAYQVIASSTATWNVVTTSSSLTTGSWTSIGTNGNLTSTGDTIIATVQDTTGNKLYRVTYVKTAGTNSATSVIERLA